jgi:hypothetical protein
MASDHASRRAAPSLLVLVRAAVEGAAEETLAEMQARVRADSISGEGRRDRALRLLVRP